MSKRDKDKANKARRAKAARQKASADRQHRADPDRGQSGKESRYWLAINGASCAMSSMPMPATVMVTPRPQMLVGFPTHGEAKTAQHNLLTDSIAKCRKLLDKWKKRHDVVIRVFKNPERPTHGPTIWQC